MNRNGVIPIVVALAIVLAIGFGMVVGNCGPNGKGGIQCMGMGPR